MENLSYFLVDLDETVVMCTLYQAAGDVVVYFLIAPSIGVVYLVTEMRKWALTEPRST